MVCVCIRRTHTCVCGHKHKFESNAGLTSYFVRASLMLLPCNCMRAYFFHLHMFMCVSVCPHIHVYACNAIYLYVSGRLGFNSVLQMVRHSKTTQKLHSSLISHSCTPHKAVVHAFARVTFSIYHAIPMEYYNNNNSSNHNHTILQLFCIKISQNVNCAATNR